MPRDNDPSHLHPAIRGILPELGARLAQADLPLLLYEGGRSPGRQAQLYAKGRSTPPIGKTVTKAKPWTSFHQFGLAVDYVFFINGAWTWQEPRAGAWAAYTKIALDLGLRALAFERPHVELPVSLSSLQMGHYPAGGDDSWTDWIESQIEAWGPDAREVGGIMMTGAPPSPSIGERPALEAA